MPVTIKEDFLREITNQKLYGAGTVTLNGADIFVAITKKQTKNGFLKVYYNMNNVNFSLGVYDPEKKLLWGYNEDFDGYEFEPSTDLTVGPSKNQLNEMIVKHLFSFFIKSIFQEDGTIDQEEIKSFCGKTFLYKEDDQDIALAMGVLVRRPGITFEEFVVDMWLDSDVWYASCNMKQLDCYFSVRDISVPEHIFYMREKDQRPNVAIAPFVRKNRERNEMLVSTLGNLQKSFAYAAASVEFLSQEVKGRYLDIINKIENEGRSGYVHISTRQRRTPISMSAPSFTRVFAPDHLCTNNYGIVSFNEIRTIKIQNKTIYRDPRLHPVVPEK